LGTDNIPDTPPAPGTLRVVVPDIDGLLPVYVYGKYEGYEERTDSTRRLLQTQAPALVKGDAGCMRAGF
jgi:hypothetical protein